MDLITPGLGLIFWTTLVFLILYFILKKFAFPSIIKMLAQREEGIEQALSSAEIAKVNLEKLAKECEIKMLEAKEERERILKKSMDMQQEIIEVGKQKAKENYDLMLKKASIEIEAEKNAAIESVKNEIASLSIEIAEQILKKNLDSNEEQQKLLDQLLNKVKL